jgi:hypothetical protein
MVVVKLERLHVKVRRMESTDKINSKGHLVKPENTTSQTKPIQTSDDHSTELLAVYHSRQNTQGWWCREHKEIITPLGWEFLPRGSAFITRKVKELGPHWKVESFNKGLKHNVSEGILAPKSNIEKAQQLAIETESNRREISERSRKRREGENLRYRNEFKQAAIQYLDFAPEHNDLANQIAEESAQRATEVGSGRVGRTGILSLPEKARLGVRATIRHDHTGYDQNLEDAKTDEHGTQIYDKLDFDNYREVKGDAMRMVDEFIKQHRRSDSTAPLQ